MPRMLICAMTILLCVVVSSTHGACNSSCPAQETAAATKESAELQEAWYSGDDDTVRKKLDQLQRLAEQATNDTGKIQALYLAGLGWRDHSTLSTEKVVDLRQAIAQLENVLELDPDHPQAHALLANVYRRLVATGNRDENIIHNAMEHREKAWQLAPDDPVVLMFEASALISIPEDRGGDIKQGIAVGFEAIGRFQFADSADTEYALAETWAVIGSGYRKLKQIELAIKAYENALKAQPNWKAIRDNVIPELESTKGNAK